MLQITKKRQKATKLLLDIKNYYFLKKNIEYHNINKQINTGITTNIDNKFKENGTEIKNKAADKIDTYIKISNFEKPLFCK